MRSKGFYEDEDKLNLYKYLKECDDIFFKLSQGLLKNNSTALNYRDIVDNSSKFTAFLDEVGLRYDSAKLAQIRHEPHSYAQHTHTLLEIGHKMRNTGVLNVEAHLITADRLHHVFETDAARLEYKKVMNMVNDAPNLLTPRVYMRAGIKAMEAVRDKHENYWYLNTRCIEFEKKLYNLFDKKSKRSDVTFGVPEKIIVTDNMGDRDKKFAIFLTDPVARFLRNIQLYNQNIIYNEPTNKKISNKNINKFVDELMYLTNKSPELEDQFSPIAQSLPVNLNDIDTIWFPCCPSEIISSRFLNVDKRRDFYHSLITIGNRSLSKTPDLDEKCLLALSDFYAEDYQLIERAANFGKVHDQRPKTHSSNNYYANNLSSKSQKSLSRYITDVKRANSNRYLRLRALQATYVLNTKRNKKINWTDESSKIDVSFYLNFERLRIGYFPVAKAGSTSIKWMFLQALELLAEMKKRGQDVHQYTYDHFTANPKNYPGESFIFAVVRDPIERFLSAYTNKIYYQPTAGWNNFQHQLFHEDDLGVNRFIDNFGEVISNNSMAFNHFMPQCAILNEKTMNSARVYRMQDLQVLVRDISNFLGRKLTLPHRQTSGAASPLQQLHPKNFEKLIDIFSEDYHFLHEFYSVRDIEKKFYNAQKAL
jgi:hypothetical protein